jgi:hypothetical protein
MGRERVKVQLLPGLEIQIRSRALLVVCAARQSDAADVARGSFSRRMGANAL